MDKRRIGNKRGAGYDIQPRVKPPAPKPSPQPKKKSKDIEFSVALPSLKVLSSRAAAFKKSLSKKPRKALSAGCVLLAIVFAVVFINRTPPTQTPDTPGSTAKDVSKAAATLQRGTPDYKTILPADKSIEQLGGWTRVSPPDRNPVFAYIDKIGNTPINVSQQPLPKGFEIEADGQLEQLAAGFKANEKVTVGSTPVYIGTSAKGPQSIIFSKSNLLVLIKSSVHVSNDQWTKYINSMQ